MALFLFGLLPGYLPLPEVQMWGWWIKQILTPIIAVVGIVGNSMSFIVMKSKALRNKSYSHYLCSLAVFDSLTLIGREILMADELRQHMGMPSLFHGFPDNACKAYKFCEHLCYLMSSWLIVAMAFERIVAVFFPFKKTSFCNQKVGVTLIVSMVIVLSCTQLFRPMMVVNSDGLCRARDDFNLIYIQLHTFLYQITLIFTLPTLLVLLCNGLILYKIHEIRKATRDYSATATTTTTTSTRLTHGSGPQHKTTFMLLVISFTHVVLILPLIALTLTILVVTKRGGMDGARFLYAMKPYGDVLEVISELNYGVNFFIYVISGKSFRRELRKLFASERRHVFSSIRTRDTNSR
ncbi:G-protein coupled receptor daf-37-like [Liolophura sinensis]|uniref:G-protein coupled receptor daf-37-like n=1 Tax=Liolophura sinensis TaxID=3198878 RepID=UPI0031580FB1